MSQADVAASIAAAIMSATQPAPPTAGEQKLADDVLAFAVQTRDALNAKIASDYTTEELKALAPSLFGGLIVLLLTDALVTYCTTDPEKFQALKDVVNDVATYVDGGLTIDKIVEADKQAKAATT